MKVLAAGGDMDASKAYLDELDTEIGYLYLGGAFDKLIERKRKHKSGENN